MHTGSGLLNGHTGQGIAKIFFRSSNFDIWMGKPVSVKAVEDHKLLRTSSL